MRRVRRGTYRRRGAAGVAFVYFSLIGLPVLFFGAGLATDFTRIVVANRQVSNAAQAAALAGAQQFAHDSAQLDKNAAIDKATETYCVAQAAGEMKLTRPTSGARPCPGSGMVSVDVEPIATALVDGKPSYTEVEVTAHFEVTGLVFSRLFGQGTSFEAKPITRTAMICLPDATDGPTVGNCVHPSH